MSRLNNFFLRLLLLLKAKLLDYKTLLRKRFVRGSKSKRQFFYGVRRFLSFYAIHKRKNKYHTFSDSIGNLEINTCGITFLSDSDFIDSANVVTESKNLLNQSPVWDNCSKNHMSEMMIPHRLLQSDSPFFEFALNRNMIELVSNYFGEIPILYRMFVWQSRFTGNLENSQLCHRDWDGMSILKVFVFLNDVDESNGPLTAYSIATSKLIEKDYSYEIGGYVSDEDLEHYANDQQVFCGKAGSVVVIDTAKCFHFGSRISSKHKKRYVACFWYAPKGAFSTPFSVFKKPEFAQYARYRESYLDKMILGSIC